MDRQVVVVTGPESSGKSQLCKDLSKALQVPTVPEYARIYLESVGPDYDYNSLREIYAGHILYQAKALEENRSPLIILDTDSINFIIWSIRAFNRVPTEAMEQLKRESHYRYLICKPDLEWEEDPLRENPHDRVEIMSEHQQLIQDLNRPHAFVEGQKKERLNNALDALQSIPPELSLSH